MRNDPKNRPRALERVIDTLVYSRHVRIRRLRSRDGLFVTYTVFGGVCSALREFIARLFSAREKLLVDAIYRLLGGDASTSGTSVDSNALAAFDGLKDPADRAAKLGKSEVAKLVLAHPLVSNLAKDPSTAPAYIPAHAFSTALIDVLVPEKSVRTVEAVREVVTQIPNDRVKNALLPLVDGAAGDMDKLQARIERYFDDAMDRATGWYKRRTHLVIFVIACVVTLAANLDSIHLVTALWQNPVQRQAVVAQVTPSLSLSNVQTELPVGWHQLPGGDSAWQWLVRAIGWLTSAIAMTMGGPFWFDVLSRFVNLRAAGPPPARSTASA